MSDFRKAIKQEQYVAPKQYPSTRLCGVIMQKDTVSVLGGLQ
jgi:hypothetical protein